jgi:hypothetical protein
MCARDLAYLSVLAHVSTHSIRCALCVHRAGLPACEQTVQHYSTTARVRCVVLYAQCCVLYLLHRGSPRLANSFGWSGRGRRRRSRSGSWGRTGRKPHRGTWGTHRRRPHLLPQVNNITNDQFISKCFDDSAVLMRSIFLDFIHRPYVFQPLRFEISLLLLYLIVCCGT